MNIACDGRALVGAHTGVGTWTTQVMSGLAREGAGTVHLAASRTIRLPPELSHPAVQTVPGPPLAMPGTLWLHTVLPARLQTIPADVWIASLAIVPRRCPVPAVAMVHDLTPRTHPFRHTLANRFAFNAYIEESLERAAAVVVGTQATENEVLSAFPHVRSRLHRIGYGVDDFYSPAPEGDDGDATRHRFSEGRPFILHLGTLEPRKRITDLVAAWERLHDYSSEVPDLVIAGAKGWGTKKIIARIEDSPLSERIHLPGYVEPAEARDLLRHAAVFALVSEVEGFGLPLAEAISCGTACVATDIPALREAGGNAALFVPPANPEELAVALIRALEPETSMDLRKRAEARAFNLRWRPIVAAWHSLLQTVVT
jgi:glycosyltransferase involved in cell wall biosynthesis